MKETKKDDSYMDILGLCEDYDDYDDDDDDDDKQGEKNTRCL